MQDDADFKMDLSGNEASATFGRLIPFPVEKYVSDEEATIFQGQETLLESDTKATITTAIILPFKYKTPSVEQTIQRELDALSPEGLLKENRSWLTRLNVCLSALKPTFSPVSKTYDGIERLIALNNLLSEHMTYQQMLEVVQLQNWHYQKNLIAFQYDVPVEYLKLDNSAWILQSVNKTLATFCTAFERQSLRHYLQSMFDDRLLEVMHLKRNILNEFEQQEKTVLLQAQAI